MKMKTPLLINVPPDSPSRRSKIKAFKTLHGIETHHCGNMDRKDHPWIAALMPQCRTLGYGVTDKSDLSDCIIKVERLMYEAGYLVTGETELKAIRTLCKANKIECPL